MTTRVRQHKSIPLRGVVSISIFLAILFFVIATAPVMRPPEASSETNFVERSTGGLSIVPASCASSPQYYHGALPVTGDTLGFVTTSGESEYGAYSSLAGVYVCVTNSSGAQYFIPANNLSELNSFKAAPPSGVSAW